MPALVKVDERLVDLAVFLRKRNFVARDVVGHLQVAARAFEFPEVVSDGLGGDEFVPEQRAKQFSTQRVLLIGN